MKAKPSSKCVVFCWAACQDKILTFDNLQQRQSKLVLVNGCILCLRNYETSCHLLLVCVVSFVTLLSRFCSAYMESNFSSWFNASWVLIGSLISNFPSCNICMFKGKGRILWKVYWVAVLWSIWLERNSRCFRTKASSLEDFSCLVKGGVHLGLQCFLNSSLMQLMIL